MEQEFHFALIDPGMTEDDVEATLGTSENVPWFSFSEFFGKEGSVPPMDRVGSVWDEHVSGIYLEQQEDIESLIAHTAWGLFRERFDHFPGQLPDSRFCAEMLGYLMGIDGRVQIEWTDFLQEDVAYHLCFTTRCKGPCEELPQEQRVCIRYCNGEWRLIR